jgi:phosphomannomutase
MSKDPIKVYDARWEAHEFSDAQVTRLFEATLAYGRELGVDTVTFTRDARLAGGHVMELGVNTALRLGFRTFVRAEPISTPQSYFTTLWVSQQHPRTMGLTITASHNPAQYLGVKFTVPTVQAIGEDCGPKGGLTRVREIYHSRQKFTSRPGGTLTLLDLGREYIDFSLKAAGIKPGTLKGLKVVLDAFNGSAGPELYPALIKAGATVHAIRLVPDGNFPTGSPNPTSQGKMDTAVAWCKAHRYDVVIGIDGDGDRMVFGDRRGILTAGFVTLPILKAAGVTGLRRPAPVLYDPKVSPLALAEWGRLGVRPVLFRNGHSQIKDYMRQIGAPAAAEESGHYYHRIKLGRLAVSSENSILTILLFLGAVKKQSRLLDELWKLQKRVFTTGEFNYQFRSDATRDRAMAAVIQHFAGQGAASVTATPDGIDLQGTVLSQGVDLTPGHVKLAPGWYSGYLRIATNEKAVVRSYFSAGDTRSGRRVETETREILEKQFSGKVID